MWMRFVEGIMNERSLNIALEKLQKGTDGHPFYPVHHTFISNVGEQAMVDVYRPMKSVMVYQGTLTATEYASKYGDEEDGND